MTRGFIRSFTSKRFLSTRPLTIGIRREDPTRIWERRSPITPEAVQYLVQEEGVNVLVQDCHRRIFPVTDFVKVSHCILSPHPLLLTDYISGWCTSSLDPRTSSYSYWNQRNSTRRTHHLSCAFPVVFFVISPTYPPHVLTYHQRAAV